MEVPYSCGRCGNIVGMNLPSRCSKCGAYLAKPLSFDEQCKRKAAEEEIAKSERWSLVLILVLVVSMGILIVYVLSTPVKNDGNLQEEDRARKVSAPASSSARASNWC